MLFEFPRLGLCERDLQAVAGKKPRWNVDHLLDRPEVALIGAYLIRSPERIEAALGKSLENDPATVVFEQGLGANDIRGNTHLLRVDADEKWWQGLALRLATLLHEKLVHPACDKPANVELCSVHGVVLIKSTPKCGELTQRMLTTLVNMWPERARFILTQVASGGSFTAANKGSLHICDTCHWGEVASRMVRARGAILTSAVQLATHGDKIVLTNSHSVELVAIAREIHSVSHRLLQALDGIRSMAIEVPATAPRTTETPLGSTPLITIAQLTGRLKASRQFLSKNLRNLPLIIEKTGKSPTSNEEASIRAEALRCVSGAQIVERICRNRLFAQCESPVKNSAIDLGLENAMQHG